jgi:hypothetical protein
MDRVNYNPDNTNHYYSQIHQENGQHTSQPETGQTSAEVAASVPSWSPPALDQPYLNFNLPAQIPSSPRPDMEYFLSLLQPVALQSVIPSQIHQEDAQYSFQPETGQTSAGLVASGPSWSLPGQPYLNPSLPAQIPSSPRPDWESLLRTPQPIALEDIIPSQIHLEDGQYTSLPETGQTSAGGPASGPSWSHPAPGQPLSYHGSNFPVQILPSPRTDWESSLRPQQPTALEDMTQNDALANPQPAVEAPRRKTQTTGLPPVKERFLAGLEAFGRGALLKDCSSSLKFGNYIKSDGSLVRQGLDLYGQLTDAEKERLEQAIIARQGVFATRDTVKKRFLAGLDSYARGATLKDCSATIPYKCYATDDGHLQNAGEDLCKGLPPEDQARVNRALLSRRESYLKRAMDNAPVEERFLAGLDNYAQGVPLRHCSATIQFKDYVTDDGKLRLRGKRMYDSLPQEDQERINRALLRRSDIYLNLTMTKGSVKKRFLASLDNYARGLLLGECSNDIQLRIYISDDGRLQSVQGRALYNSLSQDDKRRVDQALIARGRIFTQRTSKDVANFMAALELYGNGLSLKECGRYSGLKAKANLYLTPEGGLTHKGQRLIENLQPDQLNRVLDAIEKRRQHRGLNLQVSEPAWQWPDMPASIPEMRGVAPTTMVDPIPAEAMWTTAWQLTGQVVPETWGIPSESAEPSIPYYDSGAVGGDFQHQYGPHGLMPQEAPNRLGNRERQSDQYPDLNP